MKTQYLIAAGISLAVAVSWLSHPASAQQKKPLLPCGLGLVHDGGPGRALLHRAAFRAVDVPAGKVRLTFAGHSSFLIETPKGVKAVTDYNDFVQPPGLPDLVTMNTGHTTHSTENVDPAIKFVLRGWKDGGGIKRHNMSYKDLRVYNLPTNVGNSGFGFFNNSSIFVFEAAGLCIAHLGNLRHALDKERIARMGRIDIMLVPADRRITNSIEEVLHNIAQVQPRLVIPMHFNFIGNALEFAEHVRKIYPVKTHSGPTLEASRATLPAKTEVLIIPALGMEGLGGQPL